MISYQERQIISEALKGEEFYKGDNPLEEHSVCEEEEEEDTFEDFLGSEERNITTKVRIIGYICRKNSDNFKAPFICEQK